MYISILAFHGADDDVDDDDEDDDHDAVAFSFVICKCDLRCMRDATTTTTMVGLLFSRAIRMNVSVDLCFIRFCEWILCFEKISGT